MSYSVRLRASGGSLQVETITGTIPDGEFALSGHEDGETARIGVTRLGVTGISVIGVQANVDKTMPVVTS